MPQSPPPGRLLHGLAVPILACAGLLVSAAAAVLEDQHGGLSSTFSTGLMYTVDRNDACTPRSVGPTGRVSTSRARGGGCL